MIEEHHIERHYVRGESRMLYGETLCQGVILQYHSVTHCVRGYKDNNTNKSMISQNFSVSSSI